MAVEPYLEKCALFPSGPAAVAELITHLNEPLLDRIGKLNSEQYYLRFMNNPLSDSDAWVWWVSASIIGIASAWYFFGSVATKLAFGISLIAALVIFMI